MVQNISHQNKGFHEYGNLPKSLSAMHRCILGMSKHVILVNLTEKCQSSGNADTWDIGACWGLLRQLIRINDQIALDRLEMFVDKEVLVIRSKRKCNDEKISSSHDEVSSSLWGKLVQEEPLDGEKKSSGAIHSLLPQIALYLEMNIQSWKVSSHLTSSTPISTTSMNSPSSASPPPCPFLSFSVTWIANRLRHYAFLK